MYRVSCSTLLPISIMPTGSTRLQLASIFLVLSSLLLSACGFQLRNEQPLPAGITEVRLLKETTQVPLQRELKKRLKLYQIPFSEVLAPQTEEAILDIRLFPDSLDRRLLSLFPTGQVAEYELILSVRYELAFPGQAPQLVEFDITREYQDDPDEILAKSRELDLVLSEMREQASDRIIRLLASQSL